MHNAMFGRTRYLASNILELQVLAKLYNIPPMGNPKMKINWVDALVERLPEAKVVQWGELNDKASYQVQKVRMSILEAIEGVDNSHNPNAVQLAIMARLIELRSQYPNLLIDSIVELQGLKKEEVFVCSQNWKLYRLKQLLVEVLDLLENITGL